MRNLNRDDGPGRIFHITGCVNWHEWHLHDDQAKAELSALVNQAAEEFGVSIFGGALMSNHMHVVAQSPPKALYRRLTGRQTACRHFRPWPKHHCKSTVIGQFMWYVRKLMADRRHRELDLSGKFWDGPFDCRDVTNADSLVVRIAYDHRNPVRANMVDAPEDYRWSTAAEWRTGVPGALRISLPHEVPFFESLPELRSALLERQDSTTFIEKHDDVGALLRGPEDITAEHLRELFG